MADFADGFRRAGPAVGNGWQVKAKNEGTATAWLLQNEVARPANSSITTLMYRASPVGANDTYTVKWYFRWPNDGAYGANNAAECIFRYDATGGAGNSRLAIVLTGGTGKLYQRVWTLGALAQVELASWTRTDDTEFVIEAVVSDRHIAIYDDNTTGPGGLVYEFDTDYNIDHTGIGVGSGYLDRIEIDDIGNPIPQVFEFSPAVARLATECNIVWTDPSAVVPAESQMRVSGFTVPPYTVLDGLPQGIPTGHLEMELHVADGVVELSSPIPGPADVDPKSDFRFLPTASSVSGTVWSDFYARSGKELQLITPAPDPQRLASYKYSSIYGTLAREAMHFDTKGYLELAQASANLATIGVVCVFKQGYDRSYGLFQTDRTVTATGSASPLGVQYNHGRISLNGNEELTGFDTNVTSAQPVVVLLSVDPATRGVLFALQARQRYTRRLQVSTEFDTLAAGLFIGGGFSLVDEFSLYNAAAIEVLEIDLWTRPLTDDEAARYINRMSACFGVAT